MNRLLAFYARCMRKLRGIRSRCKNTAEKRGETYSRRGAQHRFNIDRNAPPRPRVFMIFPRVHARTARTISRIITEASTFKKKKKEGITIGVGTGGSR